MLPDGSALRLVLLTQATHPLQYACLYWAHHLIHYSRSETNPDIISSFERTFTRKFLFWVEVLSAIDAIDRASSIIRSVFRARDNVSGQIVLQPEGLSN